MVTHTASTGCSAQWIETRQAPPPAKIQPACQGYCLYLNLGFLNEREERLLRDNKDYIWETINTYQVYK
jgi:hypothetical protein